MSKMLLSTWGTLGNVVPFAAMGVELSRRGHDVTLITNFPHAERYRSLPIEIKSLDTERDYSSFVTDGRLLNRPTGLPRVFRKHYLPAVTREVALLEENMRRGDCAIIANEAPGIAARFVAELHHSPLLSILTYPNHLEARTLFEDLVQHVLANEINELRAVVGLRPRSDLSAWWLQVHRYIALWPEWFHSRSPEWPPRTRAVGFIYPVETENLPLPVHLERFLADGRPPILVSGGSADFAGPSFFSLICEAAVELEERLLIVSKGWTPTSVDQKRILVIEEVPSLCQLMKRARLVIHHGGMGTIGQALAAGLPQLIIADGGDRPYNGRRVEELGCGICISVGRWSPANVLRAIQTLLNDQAVSNRCRDVSCQVAKTDGLVEACDIIERLVERSALAHSCMATIPEVNTSDSNGAVPSNTSTLSNLSRDRRALIAQLLAEQRRKEIPRDLAISGEGQ